MEQINSVYSMRTQFGYNRTQFGYSTIILNKCNQILISGYVSIHMQTTQVNSTFGG